jgi:hypothetical protein
MDTKEDKGVRVYLSGIPGVCLIEQGPLLCLLAGECVVEDPETVRRMSIMGIMRGKEGREPGPHLFTLYEDTIRDEFCGLTLTYAEFSDV